MALGSSERWVGGFICDVSTPGAPMIVMTTDKSGARWSMGHLRDPDGRLVVVSA